MKRPASVVFRFRPPRVQVGPGGEFMVPLVHRNERALRRVKRMLSGGVFYVKVIGDVEPLGDGRSYFVMTKFKPTEQASSTREK